jgi:hypothetical protein
MSSLLDYGNILGSLSGKSNFTCLYPTLLTEGITDHPRGHVTVARYLFALLSDGRRGEVLMHVAESLNNWVYCYIRSTGIVQAEQSTVVSFRSSPDVSIYKVQKFSMLPSLVKPEVTTNKFTKAFPAWGHIFAANIPNVYLIILFNRPPLWSRGQSSSIHNGDVLCFLWGTNWIYICYVEESRPSMWSSGQSSWLHHGDILCFLWGTNWIYTCYVEERRPPLWSSGQNVRLQIRRPGFDFRPLLGKRK